MNRKILNSELFCNLIIASYKHKESLSKCWTIVLAKSSYLRSGDAFRSLWIIYDGVFLANCSWFKKGEFKVLLSLSIKESYFIFNDILYKQIDGLAVGSPLGPLVANAFLAHHDQK